MKRTAADLSADASGNTSASSLSRPARKKARKSNDAEQAAPVHSAEQAHQTSEAPSVSKKRARVSGSLKRLAVPRPRDAAPTRSGRLPVMNRSTLDGSLVTTPSKDALNTDDDNKSVHSEVIMIKRKNGRGMGGYMKSVVRAFTERGMREVHVHALSAAIDLALRVAIASRDALPGGKDACELAVKTTTVDVRDLVIPDDDDAEPVNQTRAKSAVKVVLKLKKGVKLDTTKPSSKSSKKARHRR